MKLLQKIRTTAKKHRAAIVVLTLVTVGVVADVSYMHVLAQQSLVVEKKPNIILILTDDQDTSLIKYMPNTRKLIRDQGAQFTNYFDNTSLCCVARSSILRGQYAHNTGIEDNVPPLGGFWKYHQVGADTDDLPVWLKNAGYTTALFGKYMNNYPSVKGGKYDGQGVSNTTVPPGWTRWFSPIKGGAYKGYNYTVNDDGKLVSYGKAPSDYLTDVISRKAVKYINYKAGTSSPFFMYVAPYSPHSPYTPPPRYENTIAKNKSIKYPRTAAFDELDMSDKPPALASRPKLTKQYIAWLDDIYRKRAAAVKGVDDMVGEIYSTLKKTGQLDNTYIVFSEDNGYHLGDHRMSPGKYTPYETDIKLNLFMRGPGIAPGSTIRSMAGNIDLAPTFVDIAGGIIPSFVDGQSLVPWMNGTADTSTSREYYLLERKASTFIGSSLQSSDVTAEEPIDPTTPAFTVSKAAYLSDPFYGVRSRSGYTYVKYLKGGEEFYDLNTDPYQINNLLQTANPPVLTEAQQLELDKLRLVLPQLLTCAADQCRSVDR